MKQLLLVLIGLAVVVGVVYFIAHSQPTESTETNGIPQLLAGTQSLFYEDKASGFALWYPKGSRVSHENLEGFLSVTDGSTVGVFLPEALFSGTNLTEAAVVVGLSSRPAVVENCENASTEHGEQSLGSETIQGQTFQVFESTGAAAGNRYESHIFRKKLESACYEIVNLLHSGNIGNYPEGTVKEFNHDEFSGILDRITKTFFFTKGVASGVIGRVELSPTCPVEKIPPDPHCAPRGYLTSVKVLKTGSETPVKTLLTDEEGWFTGKLDPGNYILVPEGGKPLPTCVSSDLTVTEKAFTSTKLSCDTGIR